LSGLVVRTEATTSRITWLTAVASVGSRRSEACVASATTWCRLLVDKVARSFCADSHLASCSRPAVITMRCLLPKSTRDAACCTAIAPARNSLMKLSTSLAVALRSSGSRRAACSACGGLHQRQEPRVAGRLRPGRAKEAGSHLAGAAIRAEEESPGDPADAVVWEQLEQSAGEETRLSITYLCFMIVATMIAGIGVMLDQPILIVGAMVVGPEFGPLVALCIGIVTRRRRPATGALGTLVLGFAVGMAATVILTWILTAVGLLDESMLIAERPLTSFIWKHDALSWIVGFLAGIAGMLALTSAKSGALVGVLISVTTIPAAANAAVAIAYWVPSEAIGSAIQLLINLSAIAVAGTLTLLVLRTRAEQLARRSPARA
jgi:uncharacterized hydrophobic protein (TIGR00271 family)